MRRREERRERVTSFHQSVKERWVMSRPKDMTRLSGIQAGQTLLFSIPLQSCGPWGFLGTRSRPEHVQIPRRVCIVGWTTRPQRQMWEALTTAPRRVSHSRTSQLPPGRRLKSRRHSRTHLSAGSRDRTVVNVRGPVIRWLPNALGHHHSRPL